MKIHFEYRREGVDVILSDKGEELGELIFPHICSDEDGVGLKSRWARAIAVMRNGHQIPVIGTRPARPIIRQYLNSNPCFMDKGNEQ